MELTHNKSRCLDEGPSPSSTPVTLSPTPDAISSFEQVMMRPRESLVVARWQDEPIQAPTIDQGVRMCVAAIGSRATCDCATAATNVDGDGLVS